MQMEPKPITKELNLFMGYTCNNNCWFCSEMANRGRQDKTTYEIKRQLDASRKEGVERITFTGGEPTVRKDILELVSYAKSAGFEEIFVITNGRMLFYKEFAKRLAKAGLTHILFSLHAPRADIHDFLTRSPGSFEQTLKGIKNMVEVGGVKVENNTVITRKNYKYLPEHAELLVRLNIDFFEFIFVNPMTIACYFGDRFEEFVPKVSEIGKYVSRALDIGVKNGIWCTAEGIPFCRMNGHEGYATELYMAQERSIVGPDNRYVADLNKSRKEKTKLKSEKCKKCRYYLICEGIWGYYAEHYGMDELRPVAGEYVRNVDELIRHESRR